MDSIFNLLLNDRVSVEQVRDGIIQSEVILPKHPELKHRPAILKLGLMILKDGSGTLLDTIVMTGDNVLLTAPIVEFLRCDDGPEAVELTCQSCIPYMPEVLLDFLEYTIHRKERLDREQAVLDLDESCREGMKHCCVYLEMIERKGMIKMVDWEIIMKELNDLIDNYELTRKRAQRTQYILEDAFLLKTLITLNPLVICDIMFAIMMNRRPLQDAAPNLFVTNISLHLYEGFELVKDGLGKVLDRFFKQVPSYQQYTSMKRILKAIFESCTTMEVNAQQQIRTLKLFYGAKLSNGSLLANQMLFSAYVYEGQDWLQRALEFLDTDWLNIRAFAKKLLSADKIETPELLERRCNLIYSLLNVDKRPEIDSLTMTKIEWLSASLNQEMDRCLGKRRDLNIFYLPAPKSGGVLEMENKGSFLSSMVDMMMNLGKKATDDSLSLMCVDKNWINLEPRAQIEARPKEIAKLVSPHKLQQEVAKTEAVNKMVIPKIVCFNCKNGWVSSSKSSRQRSATKEQNINTVWSYSREFQELEYAPGSEGAVLQPKNNWRVARAAKSNTDHGDIDNTVEFNVDMCKVLEEAYAQGEHIVNCTLDIDALAPNDISPGGRRSGTESTQVEVEIDIRLMRVIDRVDMTERQLFRSKLVEDDGIPDALVPDNSGRLSLKMPGSHRRPMEDDFVKCWICFGSGYVSRWFDKEVLASAPSPSLNIKEIITKDDLSDGSALDQIMPYCPICYSDPGIYGLSVECDHLFCKDCAGQSLHAILESGQFPANCPMCRADGKVPDPHGHDQEPVGLISRPVLTFLAEREVITKHFQFRFVNAMRRFDNSYLKKFNKDEVFECSRKDCGTFLYMPLIKKEEDLFLGQCPCGQVTCLLCHESIEVLNKFKIVEGRRVRHNHDCSKLSLKEKRKRKADSVKSLAPDLALLTKIGKKCPACGMFIQKNEGCDVMMCGDTAHGDLRKCLNNGGCGLAFNWEDLKPRDDGFTDVDGTRRHGRPVTARMVKNHPKCMRPGCKYYRSHDNIRTSLVSDPKNIQSGGGEYCCSDCKSGKSTHHKSCHKVAHPSTFDTPATSAQMMVKAGDRCVKWFVPFIARLLKIDFDLRDQPPRSYGGADFDKLIQALKPTHYQSTSSGDGYQFCMDVIGNDGRLLSPKSIYTHNISVTRHHSSITPVNPNRKIDVSKDPIYLSDIQINGRKQAYENVIPSMLMKLKYGNFQANSPNTSFSILFDLGEQCRIVGIRSTLLSHFVFRVSFASSSAEEASHARHLFQDYRVHAQTVVFDESKLDVDDGKDTATATANPKTNPNPEPIALRPPGRKLLIRKADAANPPTLPPKEVINVEHEPQTFEERRAAYAMIAEERNMILEVYGDAACECPACGTVIVKNGGDDNMMCGCEAEAAGGTMAKALAGGGCGVKFNFKTKQILGNGAPGNPANERQWRFVAR